MKIYFVRHGESEANTLNIFSNTGRKHPLTALGRTQAAELAGELEGIPFHAIYSSPILRAVETAVILSERLHAAMIQEDALREFSVGELEDHAEPEAWQRFADLNKAWYDEQWDCKLPGGDSFFDLRNRFIPFVTQLIHQYSLSSINLLLVSHGGNYRHMLPLLMSNLSVEFTREHFLQPAEFVIGEFIPQHHVCLEWAGKPLR